MPRDRGDRDNHRQIRVWRAGRPKRWKAMTSDERREEENRCARMTEPEKEIWVRENLSIGSIHGPQAAPSTGRRRLPYKPDPPKMELWGDLPQGRGRNGDGDPVQLALRLVRRLRIYKVERHIVLRIAAGASLREIAGEVGLSYETVRRRWLAFCDKVRKHSPSLIDEVISRAELRVLMGDLPHDPEPCSATCGFRGCAAANGGPPPCASAKNRLSKPNHLTNDDWWVGDGHYCPVYGEGSRESRRAVAARLLGP